jgi:hypothetical protein
MNVIPLRRPACPEGPLRPHRGAPDLTIELDRSIDGLRSLKSDLEAYYWGRPAGGSQDLERFQISHWVREVADRSAALESIALHKGSSRLRLSRVSRSERRKLQDALAALEQCVYEEYAFDRVLLIVLAALAAADRTGLRAAGGHPDPFALRGR